MNRDAPLLLRIIYPTTIVFFALVIGYGLLVGNGVLAPVEAAIQRLAAPRWLVTLGFYLLLLPIVGAGMALLTRDNRADWLNALSINRGGVALYDLGLLVVMAALVYLGWRYYGFWDVEVLSVVVIVALTALVGIMRRPPWGHIHIFQRSSDPQIVSLLPPLPSLEERYGRQEEGRWEGLLAEQRHANPDFNPTQLTPGQGLFVSREYRIEARAGGEAAEAGEAARDEPQQFDPDNLPLP